jgi:hypothetical protein
MGVRVEEVNGALRVLDEWHGGLAGRKPEVRVTVALPESTPLKLSLGNGNVSSALSGPLEARVGNGNATITGAPTALEAHVGNGKVRGGARLAGGDSSVVVGNGSIELKLLPGSAAQIAATTATGRITARGIAGEMRKNNWVGSSFKGRLGTGGADLQLEVGNGNVEVSAE